MRYYYASIRMAKIRNTPRCWQGCGETGPPIDLWWYRHSGKQFVISLKINMGGFPGGAVVDNPPADVGDTGSSPGPGRSHMPRSN